MIKDDTIIRNLIRLNNLRINKRLVYNTWQEFFLYKHIVKNNYNFDELSEEVKSILTH